mgnify:CR=1 FL=1
MGALADRRADFPILGRPFDGRPLIYLDSAATSQKPNAVIEAMNSYYREANANVRRGVYALAAESDRRFELARASIAQLVGASRETVNKALADFAHRGWLRLEGKSVLILEPERMARRAR